MEVVRAGSIVKAASRLNVTSTALSLQIKEVEDQYDVVLLTRHSRGIDPTPAGMALFDRSIHILDLVDDACRSLSVKTAAPSIRLGAPPSIARMIGVDALFAAGDLMGDVSIAMTESWTADLEARLRAGELDAVIGYDLQHSDAVVVTGFIDDTLVFIATPELAGGRGPISKSDLANSNLVFYGQQAVTYRGARSVAALANTPLLSHRHVYSINVWRSLLIRGLATSIGSAASVDDEFRQGLLVVRPIEGNPIQTQLGIAVRSDLAAQERIQSLVTLLQTLAIAGLKRSWSEMLSDTREAAET